jgi:hypothetical protein
MLINTESQFTYFIIMQTLSSFNVLLVKPQYSAPLYATTLAYISPMKAMEQKFSV